MAVALSSSDLFILYGVKRVCVGGGVRWVLQDLITRTGSGVLCFCINWKRQTLELLQGEKRPPAVSFVYFALEIVTFN